MSKRLTINILAGILIFFPTISWGVLYHTVSNDETLWRIAKKYGLSVEELRQINGLSGNLICKGQQLCVQKQAFQKEEGRKKEEVGNRQSVGADHCVYPDKQEAGSRRQNSEFRSQNTEGSQQSAGIVQKTTKSQTLHSKESYVVKKGDTLFSIARRNGCTVKELRSLNHLSDNTIEVAQVLVIPASMPSCQEAKSQENEGGGSLAEVLPLVEATPQMVEEKCPDSMDSAATTDIQFSENPNAIATQIVDAAKRYLYLPYKSGGEIGDEATDCSGFVKRTFGSFGITLPRSAREQWGKGFPVTELREGDLVFFATYASYPSHVGIYIGGDRFIHSSSYRSGGVRIDSLDSSYYHQRYLGARRVVAVE
ncbi:LysM peptidoglycan-binding domain-containing protein [bacterium]|nr:LysM peptidoglycan-binding domain-containing protein [bacterium]MBU1754419.1 LysM peptidoglycan-binding domain-containing protein [bacterium]